MGDKMNELIAIKQVEINGSPAQSVEARAFYEAIGLNPVNWARWSQANIEKSPFAIKHEDWEGFFIMKNGNETADYVLTSVFAL